MKITYRPEDNNFCLKSIMSSKLSNIQIKQILSNPKKKKEFDTVGYMSQMENYLILLLENHLLHIHYGVRLSTRKKFAKNL